LAAALPPLLLAQQLLNPAEYETLLTAAARDALLARDPATAGGAGLPYSFNLSYEWLPETMHQTPVKMHHARHSHAYCPCFGHWQWHLQAW
jgi:hypothetical protein